MNGASAEMYRVLDDDPTPENPKWIGWVVVICVCAAAVIVFCDKVIL